ncbi:HDL002Cp [Eremothecium sinecaudum]|uniref:phosphoinositide 5-phosphatase n=1 Tax=Eremothecium sinecaudum TaxID=45286 RepID=A0A0X8HSP3_9SACH|nr:HDL002Cp [Eremothecium sinecaudum]AMD20742.1 HDL002Cp [Eremothecium sinecaudum]
MKLFIRSEPRAIALSSNDYVLMFERPKDNPKISQTKSNQPLIIVKTMSEQLLAHNKFQECSVFPIKGLLGLIQVKGQVFIGLITGGKNVATPRWQKDQGNLKINESIYQILHVNFYCLDTPIYDQWFTHISEQNQERLLNEHPCAPLKKLFSDGTFYYSRDFDITNVMQERGLNFRLENVIENQDHKYIWNINLISEIVQFRQRITPAELALFDGGEFLTFIIRGFCKSILSDVLDNQTSVTLISKFSTEDHDNCFDLQKGVYDDGSVSGFVESEVIIQTERYIFAYVLTRGDVPLCWEVVEGQLLHSKKVKLTKAPEHTQISFDKHFDDMTSKYGDISIVNLTKSRSSSQQTVNAAYRTCAENKRIRFTSVDYSSDVLMKSDHKLLYFLKQDIYEFGAFAYDISKGIYVGKQTGAFRISAINSTLKPNIVEMCVSREVLDLTTNELDGFTVTNELLNQHSSLWTDNEFWLTWIYNKIMKNPARYRKLYANIFEGSSKVILYDPLHVHISKCLKQVRNEFTYEKDINIFAGSFNVNAKTSSEDLHCWLFPKDRNGGVTFADIFVVGLQEIVELTPGHMLAADPFAKQYWENTILKHLNRGGQNYICTAANQLGGVLLLLYVNETESSKIKQIEYDVKKTGFGGMSANKGAAAVRFLYSTTKFCFIVSHLAAGLENVEQRHNDYKTIMKNIRFSRGSRIKDHDGIIWMGDFNYRILLSNDEVRKAIADGDYTKLFEKDQLNQQMIAGESFPYFNEMEITFPPTYKFDPGSRTYDTSEKMRIPAWTDRILSRGDILRQLCYGCASDIIFSDHRPVYATFKARTTVIDEEKRAKLSRNFHERIAQMFAGLSEEQKYALLEEKELVVENIKAQGVVPSIFKIKRGKKLPPPSSDMKKWWVGNGKQVKVVFDIDTAEFTLNPNFPINPFVPMDTEQPMFVRKTETNLEE